MTWPILIIRRGPLVLEEATATSENRQRLVVECEPGTGACGLSDRFDRKRHNSPRAQRAFQPHAHRCPFVPRTRWPRRLAVVALALALATIGLGATAVSLAGLAARSRAATTTTIAPGYVPVPAGPPGTEPAARSMGGGR